MSAISIAAAASIMPEKLTVTWETADCAETGEPTAFVTLEFADGSIFQTDPDRARALGIALIEASGLALGARGAAIRFAAEDAADAAAIDAADISLNRGRLSL